MSATLLWAMLLTAVLFLTSACTRPAPFVVLVDSVFAAAHEPGYIDSALKQVSRRTGVQVRGVVVPPDPGADLLRSLPLADSVVILTPLLAPDAGRIAAAFPGAHIALMSDSAAAEEPAGVTLVRFDRARAMRAAGDHLGSYVAARTGKGSAGSTAAGANAAGERALVLFQADTPARRRELDQFRSGMEAADVARSTRYVVFTAPADRDALRAAIVEAKGAGAVGYALFVGRQNAYCMELLSGSDARVIVPDRMGTEAYSSEILCSVEDRFADAVAAIVAEGRSPPPVVEVDAALICGEPAAAADNSSGGH